VTVETLAISKFKATCSAVLEKVRTTGEPVLITRHGEPIAKIVPPSTPPRPENWLGCLRDRGKILGDIVAPAVPAEEWDVLRS
jgi:prevent-host-death family protein